MVEILEPKYGWITFKIDEKYYTGSYLTDLPFDILISTINMLKYHSNFCIDMDKEGSTCTIVNSMVSQELYVIDDYEKLERFEYIEPIDLANIVLSWVKDNYKAIILWDILDEEENKDEMEPDEVKNRRNLFDKLIVKLEFLICKEKGDK